MRTKIWLGLLIVIIAVWGVGSVLEAQGGLTIIVDPDPPVIYIGSGKLITVYTHPPTANIICHAGGNPATTDANGTAKFVPEDKPGTVDVYCEGSNHVMVTISLPPTDTPVPICEQTNTCPPTPTPCPAEGCNPPHIRDLNAVVCANIPNVVVRQNPDSNSPQVASIVDTHDYAVSKGLVDDTGNVQWYYIPAKNGWVSSAVVQAGGCIDITSTPGSLINPPVATLMAGKCNETLQQALGLSPMLQISYSDEADPCSAFLSAAGNKQHYSLPQQIAQKCENVISSLLPELDTIMNSLPSEEHAAFNTYLLTQSNPCDIIKNLISTHKLPDGFLKDNEEISLKMMLLSCRRQPRHLDDIAELLYGFHLTAADMNNNLNVCFILRQLTDRDMTDEQEDFFNDFIGACPDTPPEIALDAAIFASLAVSPNFVFDASLCGTLSKVLNTDWYNFRKHAPDQSMVDLFKDAVKSCQTDEIDGLSLVMYLWSIWGGLSPEQQDYYLHNANHCTVLRLYVETGEIWSPPSTVTPTPLPNPISDLSATPEATGTEEAGSTSGSGQIDKCETQPEFLTDVTIAVFVSTATDSPTPCGLGSGQPGKINLGDHDVKGKPSLYQNTRMAFIDSTGTLWIGSLGENGELGDIQPYLHSDDMYKIDVDYPVSWSHDGDYILVTVKNNQDGTEGIYRVSTTTSENSLGEPYIANAVNPTYSPDGKIIVYVAAGAIFYQDVSSGLSNFIDNPTNETNCASPAFESNSLGFLFTCRDENGMRLYRYDKRGFTLQVMITNLGDIGGQINNLAAGPVEGDFAFDSQNAVYFCHIETLANESLTCTAVKLFDNASSLQWAARWEEINTG